MTYTQFLENIHKSSPYFMECSVKMSVRGLFVYNQWTYDIYNFDISKPGGEVRRNIPRYFRDVPQTFETRMVKQMKYDLCYN